MTTKYDAQSVVRRLHQVGYSLEKTDQTPKLTQLMKDSITLIEQMHADVKALAEALLEFKRAERISESLLMIERRRWPAGACGVGVDKDADALEWQRLHKEQGEILNRRAAALARIQGETG